MNLLAWGAALGLLFHVGSGEVRRFERLAAEDIAAKLSGPAKEVAVRTKFSSLIGAAQGRLSKVVLQARQFTTGGLPLHTEPSRPQSGSIGSLEIELEDFELTGLPVRKLTASIPDCRFDFGLARREGKVRLSKSGIGVGWVQVEEDALETFILKKFREIKEVSVRLEKEHVFVKGRGEFLLFDSEFEVIARFAVEEGVRFLLTDAKIWFDGLSTDAASRQILLDTLNPVVDLDQDLKLLAAIRVEKFSLHDGLLEAWGRARIPEAPAQASNPLVGAGDQIVYPQAR
ncbi:MAG: LmeA family phospholipid-binding protein [Fimbriimonadaceae bacterium]|nr:LmeA family phospholipid-binding protein [Fimbriimonadaceae bacterium]